MRGIVPVRSLRRRTIPLQRYDELVMLSNPVDRLTYDAPCVGIDGHNGERTAPLAVVRHVDDESRDLRVRRKRVPYAVF